MSVQPCVLVLGGSGRVGRLLAGAGSGDATSSWLWQGRRPDPSIDWVCDPLEAGVEGLAEGLRQHLASTVLVLLGVVPADTGADPTLNVTLARIALEAALAADVPHVILASSIAVYGKSLRAGVLAGETTPVLANAGYGAAKVSMERMAADFSARHGATAPGITVLRLANVLGADQLSRAILSGSPVVLDRFAGGCGAKRSFLSPGTLLTAVAALAVDPPQRGAFETFNLADASRAYDMSEIVRACERQGRNVDWSWRDADASALPLAAMSVEAIEQRVPDIRAARLQDADQLVCDWFAAIEGRP